MSKLFFNHMDSPTSDGLNNFLISSEVKKNGGKVSISGVGADEFFSGYPSFNRIPKIFSFLKFLPTINFSDRNYLLKVLNKLNINSKFLGLLKYNKNYEEIFFLQRSFAFRELNYYLNIDTINEGLEELNLFDQLSKDVKNSKTIIF